MRSVPYFIPIEKVFNVFPLSFKRDEAILATKLESSPPERRHPIGRSDMSLSYTALLKVDTIF
jgi:hypothetical protein